MHIIKPILQLIAEYAAEYKLREWIPSDKIHWGWLSANPNDGAIALLNANQDKIDWSCLSRNTNDGALELLNKNQDNIDWWMLSWNPNDGALKLLNKNQDKINWHLLSDCLHIFELNTETVYSNLLRLAN